MESASSRLMRAECMSAWSQHWKMTVFTSSTSVKVFCCECLTLCGTLSFLLCIFLLRDFLVYSTPLRFHINYRFNLPLYEKCIFSMVKGLRLICIFAFYGINIFRILSSNPWMQDLLSYFYVFFNFWKQCFVVQCARLSPLWLLLFLLYFIFLDATFLDF